MQKRFVYILLSLSLCVGGLLVLSSASTVETENAAYASPAVMRDRPAWEINGYRTIDGSAMIETYTFECRDARGGAVTTVTFSPDLPDSGDGIGLRIERQGQPERTLSIVPAYWLDMLPPQPR